MITRFLLQNPKLAGLIVATILIAGIASLAVMPRLEDPVLKRRVAVITTAMPGASVTEIEASVSIPIELWLTEIAQVKQVRTNTRANVANVVVELQDETRQPEDVWATINEMLLRRSHELPEGCEQPELKVFPLKANAAILAVVPGKDSQLKVHQLRRLASELQQRISNLPGTERVERFGDPGEQWMVKLRPEVLASTGLSVGAVAAQLADNNLLPGGQLEFGATNLLTGLQVDGTFVRQLEQILIRLPVNGTTVQLAELASVSRDVPRPIRSEAIIDGQPGIALGAMVTADTRVDEWTRELNRTVERFESELGSDADVRFLFRQSDYIQSRMLSLLRNLAISTLAVAAVTCLMMGWRCMLVVIVTLPLTACLVLFGMRLLSIPIHQISITGLVVALGLLIDNAIVMVEEVRSRIMRGAGPWSAIRRAVRQLGLPLLGSSLTTVLAFLPIATMPGPAGEFVGTLAISVILAITASFLLAITLVPCLVAMFRVSSWRTGFWEYGLKLRFLKDAYRASLQFVFRRPVLGVLLGLVFPALGWVAAQSLQKEFFPATDRKQVQIEVELPAAATPQSLREVLAEVRESVDADPRVSRQHWFLGQSAPTFFYNLVPRRINSPAYAQALIELRADTDVDSLVNQLQDKLDGAVFSARIVVRKLEQGPPFDAPVEVRVFGENLAMLERLGNDIRSSLATLAEVTHTRSDLDDTVAELDLAVDEAGYSRSGLTRREIAKALHAGLDGVVVGDYYVDGESLPLRVAVDYGDRPRLDSLAALTVATPAGADANATAQPAGRGSARIAPLTIGSLGEFRLSSDVAAIQRINGERVNEVKAYLRAGTLPAAVLERFQAALGNGEIELPPGYRIEFGGESEKRRQAISTLVANGVLLAAIMLLTLVAVLGSVRSALVIAMVGGLAVGLGPLALYAFGFPFGFMAIVGAMGLVGIAINDSIVVLAALRSNQRLPAEPTSPRESESPAGSQPDPAESVRQPASEVVIHSTRHILTTTFTTIVGFLPLVLNGGKFWPPLAIVISAGVGGATLLALYFVPSLYLLLHGNKAAAEEVA